MVELYAPTIIPAVEAFRRSGLGLKSATSGFTDEALRQVGNKLDVWPALG